MFGKKPYLYILSVISLSTVTHRLRSPMIALSFATHLMLTSLSLELGPSVEQDIPALCHGQPE